MRALGIVAILAVGLAGCGGDSGGGTATATGITGTWNLDVTHLKGELSKMFDKMLEAAPEAARAGAMVERDKQLKMLDDGKMSLTINADGTYTANSYDPEDKKNEKSKGTWKEESDGTYTVQKTHQDGKASEEDAFNVRMEDGYLYGKPEKGMPFEMRLKR